jgi:hypothetical protein
MRVEEQEASNGKPGKPVFSLSFQCSSTVRSRIKSRAVPVPVTTTKSFSRTLCGAIRRIVGPQCSYTGANTPTSPLTRGVQCWRMTIDSGRRTMNRKKITIIAPLKATLVDELSVRTFHTGETVWWDTEQTCDPVEFEVDNFRFSAVRGQFLRSAGFPTPPTTRAQ